MRHAPSHATRSTLAPVLLCALLLLPVAAVATTSENHSAKKPDLLHLAIGDPDQSDHTVDLVVDALVDTKTGEALTPAQVAARLEGVHLVFFGELHTSMDVHRSQLRLLQELERTGRPLLIGLEMYPYTAQEGLDRWVDGLLTEEGFLEIGGWWEHWGLHWGYYRDIFLFARNHDVPMFGVNTPREVVAAVRTKGLDALTEEERSRVPPSMEMESEDHRTLFRAFMTGDEDDDETIHSSMSDEQLEAMRSAQVTWDASMAYNAVRALENLGETERDPIMVVLIGSGHVAYGLGAERQARQWFDGEIASVIPVPAEDEDEEPVETVQASYADFVWGLPAGEEPLYPGLGSSTTQSDEPAGRRVIFVPEGTVAERAGLQVGDVIVAVDGRPTPDKVAYNRELADYRWGDTATFTVLRDGEEKTLEVAFRRLPDEDEDEGEGDTTAE